MIISTMLVVFLFKRLDPLNVPTLTAEQLAEKQRLADEKREVVSAIDHNLLFTL